MFCSAQFALGKSFTWLRRVAGAHANWTVEPGTQHFTLATVCRSSGAPGLTASTRSGRRSAFCGHRGADWRRSSWVACSRCSCAADGGPVGGCAADRRSLRPRAGDRIAQDLKPFLSYSSSGSSCTADGGTVGGRAIAGVDAACARLRCLRQGVDLRVDAVHRDLLNPGGHQALPEDPPDRVHRQPRAVQKYWARLRCGSLWTSL